MSSGARVMSRLPLKNIWSKNNFDELIMTACVQCGFNTEAP
jgi:hypothetical protein